MLVKNMKLEATSKRLRWFNPVTIVFLVSLVAYTIFCAYWASIDAVLSRGFFDYLALSAYPVSVPVQSFLFYLQTLQDPYTGYAWQWSIAICAVLAIALGAVLVGSIVAQDDRIRKISIRAGIPVVLLWIIGAFLAIPLSSIH